MRRSLQTVSKRAGFTRTELSGGHPKPSHSRTAWQRWLYAAAPSLVAVLSMSTLTVVVLLLVVTTVADAGLHVRAHNNASRWNSSSPISFGDNGAAGYADMTFWDEMTEDRVETTYVAAWMSDE